MPSRETFGDRLVAKVRQQLHSQRVGYLLGAGSSFLGGAGYPLAATLWERIADRVRDEPRREEIQAALDEGASGLEGALDTLDDGGAHDTAHRHLVTRAIAELFAEMRPELGLHRSFVERLAVRPPPPVQVFSLNYDPLIERAAEASKVRLVDGFVGGECAFFEPSVFEERVYRIRGSHRGRKPEEVARPIRLLKLHGSLGWYEDTELGPRRGAPALAVPEGAKLLMVPPQRRKAAETMLPPYAALWSSFRGSLSQDHVQLNRLVCVGYGFADEHVNAVIENALVRQDFTLLILTKSLSDAAWTRWSGRGNVLVATETRSSLYEEIGPGHPDIWSFERVVEEV